MAFISEYFSYKKENYSHTNTSKYGIAFIFIGTSLLIFKPI